MTMMLLRDINRMTMMLQGLKSRDDIEEFVSSVGSLPGALGNDPFPLYHTFSGGIYAREVHLPAGHVVIGKIHKHKSLVNVISGKLAVVDEHGYKVVEGPCKFESEGGIRRVAFVLEDTIWTDYHNTKYETVDDAESDIFAADYGALEYSDMAKSIGYTEKEISEISRNESDVITDKQPGVTVRESSIQGVGVFADKDYSEGDIIGRALISDRRTLIGRYTNHSSTPNCKKTQITNGIAFSATKNIVKDDEIAVDYADVAESRL